MSQRRVCVRGRPYRAGPTLKLTRLGNSKAGFIADTIIGNPRQSWDNARAILDNPGTMPEQSSPPCLGSLFCFVSPYFCSLLPDNWLSVLTGVSDLHLFQHLNESTSSWMVPNPNQNLLRKRKANETKYKRKVRFDLGYLFFCPEIKSDQNDDFKHVMCIWFDSTVQITNTGIDLSRLICIIIINNEWLIE